MLSACTLIKPLTTIETDDYEEVDLTFIDMDALSPEEINALMAKKKKAEIMKEKKRKRKENPEEFQKDQEEEKRKSKNKVLTSTEGILCIFGNYDTPITAFVDVVKKQSQVIRVPNNFSPFNHTRVHKLMDGTRLLFSDHQENHQTKMEFIHFDPHLWTFSSIPARVKRVYGSAIVQLEMESMYLVGGWRESSDSLMSNNMEVYDFATQKWRLLASMRLTRQKYTCFAWHKWIYVVGGINKDTEIESSIERYCPIANDWEILSIKFTTKICQGLPIPRMKDILVLGGFTKAAMLDTVYALTFLEELPPKCAFINNNPILKLTYKPEFIDLGIIQLLSYREVDSRSMPTRRVIRTIDVQTCVIGPEIEVDIAAQLDGLGIAPESFG